MIKAPATIRLRNSFNGIIHVLRRPSYAITALLLSFFVSGFIIWSLNFDLARYVVFDAPLNVPDKMRFFWDVHTSVYSVYASSQATGILLFGLLFGINSAMLVYSLRRGKLRTLPKKSGSAALVFAVLGGGCIACGTSLLAPLIATIGATSSAFISSLSNVLNWISIILILYSIYKLGGVIANSRDTTNS